MKTTTLKAPKNFDNLITAIKAGKLESNNQLTYMMSCLNNKPELKQLIDEALNCSELQLCEDQVKKGYDWLEDQWRSPVTGNNRKNNPFGYREQSAIENFDTITFYGYYDAGNYGHAWYVPIYYVYGKDQSAFEYVVYGGKIHIIG